MSVYVDDGRREYHPPHVPGRRYIMCHMLADEEAELHAMADRIGISRAHFQGDHYDISASRRERAVAEGAIEITQRQAVWIRHRFRGKVAARARAAG